jgi:hypothetical protein
MVETGGVGVVGVVGVVGAGSDGEAGGAVVVSTGFVATRRGLVVDAPACTARS